MVIPNCAFPEWRSHSFLECDVSRVFVLGPLGFLIGFVVAVSQSVGEAVPSPELLVRGLLWLWVAIAYGVGLTVVLNFCFCRTRRRPACTSAETERPSELFICAGRVHQSRARAFRAQSHLRSDVLLHLLYGD